METKQSARELLKEARGASVTVLDGLNARIDRASKQGEPIPVYNGIVELHDIIGKIDAYLAAQPIEVPSDAGEVVNAIILLFAEAQVGQTEEAIAKAIAEAAALIESYGRRVPRAMLEELFDTGYREGDRHIAYDSIDPIRRGLNRIAAKYGVKVDG